MFQTFYHIFCCMLPLSSVNMYTATNELSSQLTCIVRCHWRVYSSCNSAVHQHHRR